MTKTSTAGQALTVELRKAYAIGPRTRWNRRAGRMVNRGYMLSDIRDAIGEYRGMESAERTAIFDNAHTALAAYGKFVDSYRIDGLLRCEITTTSPWEFTAFLGEMVDSGASNMAEFEMWFVAKTRELYAARSAA
jgi:hypothetical protein